MTRYCLSSLHEIDAAVTAARRILVASDFDGTLCPIAGTPDDVRVPPAVYEILRRVSCSERIHFAVLTGRSLADISRRLPPGITVAGNHGLEIEGPGIRFEHEAARRLRPRLAEACDELSDAVSPWAGAWVENKGLSATLHYRLVDVRLHRSLRYAARSRLAAFPGFALRAGKMALEIRPKASWDKGEAVRYIRECAGPFDVSICLGDDRTDETMFHPDHVSVRVGCGQPSRAHYHLIDTHEAGIFLSHILDMCEAVPAFAAAAGKQALSAVRTAGANAY